MRSLGQRTAIVRGRWREADFPERRCAGVRGTGGRREGDAPHRRKEVSCLGGLVRRLFLLMAVSGFPIWFFRKMMLHLFETNRIQKNKRMKSIVARSANGFTILPWVTRTEVLPQERRSRIFPKIGCALCAVSAKTSSSRSRSKPSPVRKRRNAASPSACSVRLFYDASEVGRPLRY